MVYLLLDHRLVDPCRVREIISESCKAVTLETVKQKLRLSPPTRTLASTSRCSNILRNTSLVFCLEREDLNQRVGENLLIGGTGLCRNKVRCTEEILMYVD